MDSKELQKLSRNFRIAASRLLNTSYPDAIDNLKRFLNFIDKDDTISRFIAENNNAIFNIDEIIKNKESDDRYPSQYAKSDEIAFTYQLLEYAAENYYEYYQLSKGYAFSNLFKDHADEFNKDVVNPFIQHITTYLEELAIDLRDSQPNKSLSVHLNGENKGLISVNQDGSTIISDNIFNNSDLKNIDELISSISEIIISDKCLGTHKDEMIEILTDIRGELASKKTKRNYVLFLLEKLSQIQNVVNLGITLSGPMKMLYDTIVQYLNVMVK